MEWVQVWTIIGVLGGFLGIIASIMMWQFSSIHNDIGKLTSRLDGHANRIDQLYHMFVDMQARMENRFREVDQKFYDLLSKKN